MGTHKGYIRRFNNGNEKIGCLVGKLHVSTDKITKL